MVKSHYLDRLSLNISVSRLLLDNLLLLLLPSQSLRLANYAVVRHLFYLNSGV